MLGEGAHVEVVQDDVFHPEHRGGLARLVRERVGREALGQRVVGDREGDVANVATGAGEPGERRAAPELTIVGVRGENQSALPAVG